jgi:tetratricopeptide (TPR) repeat protein
MKKFLFSAVAVLFCLGLSAQDVKKIRNAYDKKDWPKAKEAVDLALANEKEQKNWEAWYYKGLIYGQIAKDANLKATVPDAWVQSFEAYQKAMELDKKQAEIFMMTRQYPVFENYLELQKEANTLYNSGNYQGALDGYKKADKVGRFIFANKWALSEVDTILYYYAGAAAMQLENKEEVVSFFQKIADANIGGEGYDVVYRYLAYYYDQKKDTEAAKKYTEAGRKLYPKDMYYDRIELDKMRKSGASALDIFKKYETIIAGEAKDYELRYDYAAEIFNWLYMDSKATAEQKPEYFAKILSTLKNCIELDPKQPDAHLLLGKTYFNEAAFMQDEMKKIKGTTPADTQKKTEMKKQMEDRMKEALPHLDNSLVIYTAMTPDQLKDKRTKNEYKSTLYLLTEAHRFLGNKDKEKEFDAKYQALNQ